METERADALLAQAQEQLAAARQRVRDLEGFVRIYQELRRGVPASALTPVPPERSVADTPWLPNDRGRTVSRNDRPAIVLADPDLSISEAAAKVLRHSGYPMKARRIAETMLAWQYPYTKGVDDLRASVGGVLARAVREGDTFVKLATGLFGLAEWGPDTQVDMDEAGDGPTGTTDGEMEMVEESLFTSVADVDME